jgi:hypothetical protein
MAFMVISPVTHLTEWCAKSLQRAEKSSPVLEKSAFLYLFEFVEVDIIYLTLFIVLHIVKNSASVLRRNSVSSLRPICGTSCNPGGRSDCTSTTVVTVEQQRKA